MLVVQTALELGFLYAPVALALFLSFRVLDIADLTTDGRFVLGAAVSVTLTAAGIPCWPFRRPCWRGRAPGPSPPSSRPGCRCLPFWRASSPIRGFYTINLMAMGWRSNESLLGGDTVFTLLRSIGLGGDWYELVLAAAVTLLCAGLLALFLGTRLGLSIRATGDNPDMVRASSLDPTFTVTVGLCLSNAPDGSVRRHGGTVSENRGHQLRHRHRGHRACVSHHRRDRLGPPHGV